MKSVLRYFLFPILLVAKVATPLFAADAPVVVVTQPWPQDVSDLKPDPAAVFGTLPNGLRYIILPNQEPPGRVSLRLRVNAGSFMEAESQRGLAHFLEHMAFNGSKHYPHDAMVGVFQRLGMGFGADTNANTAFQRTLFKLDLPDITDQTLREGFQYFGDVADNLLLQQTEVDRERGVILSETRDADSVSYRTTVARLAFYFPDMLLSKRLPLGLVSVVKESARDRFVDLYEKWYTADRMTLIIVGDIKVENMVPLIKEYFGGIAPRPHAPDPDLGKVGTAGFQAALHREVEAPSVNLELTTISPFTLGPDRIARETLELQLDAANAIIRRRLTRIYRQPNAPITNGDAYSSHSYDAFQSSEISASCQPDHWRDALNIIEQELRRAIDYGFTDAEVEEVRSNLLNSFEVQAKSAATRKSRDLIEMVADSLDENAVFTSPAQDLELAKPILTSLTAQQCQEVLRQAWSYSGRRLFVSGNLDLPDSEKTLTQAYEKSAATPVEKPAVMAKVIFGYASTGEPGQIVERHELPDLGITQLRFANNVRVNLKHTDFDVNKISVVVQFGGGMLELPKDKPGLAFVANSIVTEGGLGKHSAEEIQQILAGKTVSTGFSIGDRFFQFGGVTTPQDLRMELELIKARLTDSGYRPEALSEARRNFPATFNSLRQNVAATLANEVPRFIASGDYHFGYPTEAQAEAVTSEDVRAWLTPSMQSSYLEISIVGDFDPKAAEAALAAVFGTLPPRAEKRADYSAALNVHFPVASEGQVKTFTVPSVIPKAEAVDFWPTTDMSDFQRSSAIDVLAEIFSDRLRVQVRQKLGQAYSPYAYNDSSEIYPAYGYTMSLITAEPKLAASLGDLARTIADELTSGNITPDEFNRAITPLRLALPETFRKNNYWLLSVLAGSQAFPQLLDWARALPTVYDKITLDQVKALAKEYFGAAHAVRILVLPEAPETIPAPANSTTPTP